MTTAPRSRWHARQAKSARRPVLVTSLLEAAIVDSGGQARSGAKKAAGAADPQRSALAEAPAAGHSGQEQGPCQQEEEIRQLHAWDRDVRRVTIHVQPAWSTSREQEPRRVAMARRSASCNSRPSNVGSTPARATVPGAPERSSGARTGRSRTLTSAARSARGQHTPARQAR